MKKLLLFVFLLIFGFQSKAQIWCAPGATWHYRVYSSFIPYYDGHIKLQVTNTVSINSITCQNMVGIYYGQTMSPTFPTTTINNYVNVQTYENNGVVYIYNTVSLNFDTITNFNANIGDKWLGIKYPNTTCFSPTYVRATLTVIDTGHVTINSVFLKKIKVSVQSPSSLTGTITMVEKISALNGFLFNYSHCIIDGPIYGNFVCYSDSNFPLYNPTSAICNYVPSGVGINENSISNSILKPYPNPTNGIFHIELNEPINLKVYSATGALVFERTFNEKGNFQLDMSDLSNGIYHLRTETSSGSSYSKLIKK